jgi:hypothetical protein
MHEHARGGAECRVNQRTSLNLAASIRQRLLNKAQQTGRPFNEILQYFAMERFLYRLAKPLMRASSYS